MDLQDVNTRRRVKGKLPLGWSTRVLGEFVLLSQQDLLGINVVSVKKSGLDYRWGHKRLDCKNGS